MITRSFFFVRKIPAQINQMCLVFLLSVICRFRSKSLSWWHFVQSVKLIMKIGLLSDVFSLVLKNGNRRIKFVLLLLLTLIAWSRCVLTIPSTVLYLSLYLNLQFNRCTGTWKNIDFLLMTRVSIFYLMIYKSDV